MATMKVAPKIPFAILKTFINECDHILGDVEAIPCSWNFQIFKDELGIKSKPLFELKLNCLNFKNPQSLWVASYKHCKAT